MEFLKFSRYGPLFLLSFAPFLNVSCYAASDVDVAAGELTVTSHAFEQGGMIPAKYTCDGANVSPSLRWAGAPQGTQSFAIIADDPDAPTGTWVHWVLFDLPPTVDMIPEGVPPIRKLANAEKHGISDFKKYGYGGPCPPTGTHRYYFKVYALDQMLQLDSDVTKDTLLEAMEGHILAKGELMGRYERSG